MSTWIAQRDENLAEMQAKTVRLLLGREVVGVEARPHMDVCDGENVLRLHLSDGTSVEFIGGYGGYSGRSCDEYVELIRVREVPA